MFEEHIIVTKTSKYFDKDFLCFITEGGETLEVYYYYNGKEIDVKEANQLQDMDIYPEIRYFYEGGEECTSYFV